eukprot:UN09606
MSDIKIVETSLFASTTLLPSQNTKQSSILMNTTPAQTTTTTTNVTFPNDPLSQLANLNTMQTTTTK